MSEYVKPSETKPQSLPSRWRAEANNTDPQVGPIYQGCCAHTQRSCADELERERLMDSRPQQNAQVVTHLRKRAEKAERELAAARRRNRLLSRQLTEDFRVGATCDTEAERIAACRAADDQQGIARSSVAKLPAYHRGIQTPWDVYGEDV